MINSRYITDEFELNHNENKESKNRVHTFEEAVSELGTGRFHVFIVFICGAALLSSVNEGLVIGFVLPYLKCDLHMTPYEQGLLNSVGFCGIILSSHFWGFLADTWGRRKVMKTSVITAFMFSALSSVANNVWLMIGLRFVVGLCVAGVQMSTIAYLGEFHSDRTRSKYVTLTAMWTTISTLYMSSIGWLIIPTEWETELFGMIYRPWRLFILVSSCSNLFAFFGLLVMPDSPKFMLAMGKKQEALDIIKSVYQVNTGNRKETFPIHELALEKLGSNLADAHGFVGVLRMMWIQTKPLFMRPHVSNLLRLMFINVGLFCVAHGLYMWYPEILSIYYKNMDEPVTICRAIFLSAIPRNTSSIDKDEFTNVSTEICTVTNSSTTYPIFMSMGIIFIVLYSLVAVFMGHIDRRILITTWIIPTIAASIGLIWTTNFYLIQALVTIVISVGSCGSVLTAISADLFPTRYKGMALCLILLSARLGAVIGNNLFAALLYDYCSGIFYIFAAFPFIGMLLYVTITRKSSTD